jgi:hypothetical protein
LSNNGFQYQLGFGKIAESAIAKYLIEEKGYAILPVYEIEHPNRKGPRLSSGGDELRAPDMLAFRDDKTLWIEAKHKTAFTWHRKTSKWVTGIDMSCYQDYLKINERIHHPVWLMFLHCSSTPDTRDLRHGCPNRCPVGLYGNTLDYLHSRVNHTFRGYGHGGMVYWAESKLHKIAEASDCLRIVAGEAIHA